MTSDTASHHQNYLSTKHILSLNGVRCLCILGVLWHHAADFKNLPNITLLGYLGVDMFFVLSGYLIVTLVLREKSRTGEFSLRNFYIRRTLRIFPVYYGTLLAVSALYFIFKPADESTQVLAETLPYYLTFTANWALIHAANMGIYWSLATEEQFYLVWPFLEKFFSLKFLYTVLVVAIGVNQLINFGLLDGYLNAWWGEGATEKLNILDTTFTPICFGVALAHALHRKSSFDFLYAWLGSWRASLIVLLTLVLVLQFATGDISGAVRLLIQALMTVWLGCIVMNSKHFLSSVLQWRIVDRIGAISYGAYIYHLLVFHFVREVLAKLGWSVFGLEMFLFGTLATLIVSELSFRFYESPFLSLKSKLEFKRSSLPV
ncbi:acyltransferase family protein [Teredinibacter waterburyi]|jgi:Predicted acyltransferases|uniref:acyltransferase family protein n=1 Tax=Teredinibacter waterburyi TaxID=1500538 RepID=UPI00165F1B07|nr:acyltransferase [Teredinibacter waterburyi]